MSGENISTFVVLDLETNGLPCEQFNKCSITEISLFAFSAKCLMDGDVNKHLLENVIGDGVDGFDPLPPELPRVLNKLTLMINPMRTIHPSAEGVTGLNNYILENESPFDEKTATCLNLFLGRLEQPVCLVAHNGWSFDYPIIRHVYEKIQMSLPPNIYCVDSFKAFRELDEKTEQIKQSKQELTVINRNKNDVKTVETSLKNEELEDLLTTKNDPLEQNSEINWELNNETTPQRKIDSKKHNEKNMNLKTSESTDRKQYVSLSVRRSLFTDNFKPKTKYPPKGVYKLGKIYKRCFNRDPLNLHRAESDVEILTKLILHYGLDFLAYAEERKQLFTNVPKLGSQY